MFAEIRSFIAEVMLPVSIIAVVVIVPASCLVAWGESASCHAEWADSGFRSQWGLMSGCRISKDGRIWTPARKWRDLRVTESEE